MARKLIRSRDVMFLKDQIVGDVEKSDDSQSSLDILVIPTSVSPHVVHNDHGEAGEDNNDDLAELVEQPPPESPAPAIKPELRRPFRE